MTLGPFYQEMGREEQPLTAHSIPVFLGHRTLFPSFPGGFPYLQVTEMLQTREERDQGIPSARDARK